jgi:hypothetical protein
MQQQTESLRQPRYTKDKFCLLLLFVYFSVLFYFCICLALGFGSFSELYIFGNLSAGGKDRL